MANGHRGVSRGQQHRDRLAHDVRAAHHHGAGATHPRAGLFDQFHDPVGRAGDETWLADEQAAQILGVKTVHVLGRIDGQQDALAVDVGRQRHLHENPVHRAIGTERTHQVEKLALRCGSRQVVVKQR